MIQTSKSSNFYYFSQRIKKFASKFSKTLLGMISILPIAGLLISLGKIIGPLGLGKIDNATSQKIFNLIGNVIEQLGWLPFVHMGLLFAIAIGGSWAKDKSGGSFNAAIAYLCLLTISASMFLVNNDGDKFFNYIIGSWTNISGYFEQKNGINGLSYGVMGGVICGFVGGIIYNKWHTYNNLPNFLSFFNGARLVPTITIFFMIFLGILLGLIWPLFQALMNWFGKTIINNKDTPFIAPFLYGFLERLLLPFGLHHMITTPMNHTNLGGKIDFLNPNSENIKNIANHLKITNNEVINFFNWLVEKKGIKSETLVKEGQEAGWFTWINALTLVKENYTEYAKINNLSISSNDFFHAVTASFHPARFKIGQVIISNAGLLGASLGLYYCLPKINRQVNKSIYISGIFACFFTGVTEPIEFIFMFASPTLYLIHAILTGIAFGFADIWPMRIHTFGFLEVIVKYLIIQAPLSLFAYSYTNFLYDGLYFVLTCILFFVIYFVTFYSYGRYIKPNIPGILLETKTQNKQEIKNEMAKNDLSKEMIEENIAKKIINLLGGLNNLVDVDACISRLRVIVKDKKLVNDKFVNETKALAVVWMGEQIQIIYGTIAETYKEIINKIWTESKQV